MPHSPVLGGELLRLVTAGMYDNPLDLYREYIQNTADAVAAQHPSTGSVSITIDPFRSQITILDDSTGIDPDEAIHRLMDLGRSPKDPFVDRGFRGIGRLAALAFAEELHFTTRTCADHPPIRVSWNARALRTLDLARIDAKKAIQECTSTTLVSYGEWPANFFQVNIDRVNRQAASTLLNEDAVRRYLGEVCPVPLAANFPLAKEILKFLASHTNYLVLDIRVNDDKHPIERPFKETIPLTENFAAPFETLETRVIPRADADEAAAVMWLAHTSYAGSIPRNLGVRGLRARVGNLQIGNEHIFEHLFLEPRFNGWCVGEVHILDNRIVPNGRRDYFELGPHLRNLENHIGAVAQEISVQCRRASSQRNKLRNLSTAIHRLKSAAHLVRSGYLHEADAVELVARERRRLPDIRKTLTQIEATGTQNPLDELAFCEHQFDEFEANPDLIPVTIPPSARPALEAAFGAIVRAIPPDAALNLIETILQNLTQTELSHQPSRVDNG